MCSFVQLWLWHSQFSLMLTSSLRAHLLYCGFDIFTQIKSSSSKSPIHHTYSEWKGNVKLIYKLFVSFWSPFKSGLSCSRTDVNIAKGTTDPRITDKTSLWNGFYKTIMIFGDTVDLYPRWDKTDQMAASLAQRRRSSLIWVNCKCFLMI